MALIRIGFIGLSASGGWAGSAHWPYLKQTDKYTVTALLNSSIDSAKKARSHFELPESTKLYDSAEKLAEDPEIDLIVCSIRVNLHYDAIKPVLKAKKTVYCEWPLGANVTEAEELAQLAKENSPKSMIGLQTRQDPVIHKVKTLLEQNTIGRVLSSNLMAAAGLWGATHGAETSYFNDPKVGGNLLSIAFGHTVDYAMFTLGELKDLAGRVSVQRPQVDFMKDGKKVETADRKTPDQIMLQGQLQLGGKCHCAFHVACKASTDLLQELCLCTCVEGRPSKESQVSRGESTANGAKFRSPLLVLSFNLAIRM